MYMMMSSEFLSSLNFGPYRHTYTHVGSKKGEKERKNNDLQSPSTLNIKIRSMNEDILWSWCYKYSHSCNNCFLECRLGAPGYMVMSTATGGLKKLKTSLRQL